MAICSQLGKAINQLVTIVTPGTFLRWIREDKRAAQKGLPIAKRGRRRTAEQIRKLVIKLAKENIWGYTRIVGELRKLRIRSVSKSTVRNILKEYGLDRCPKRSGTTWDEFVGRHAASLWQADFLSQRILTAKGLRDSSGAAFRRYMQIFSDDLQFSTDSGSAQYYLSSARMIRMLERSAASDGCTGVATKRATVRISAERLEACNR